jgi:acyl-coenzyme A synthetase/AMP-(fatty) acid ligase
VEASVVLSLVLGIPVLERRPLLPADVRSAIEGGAQGTVWIATPLHLRAIVQTGDAITGCSAIIASTMPLAQALAAKAEELVNAPVLEIYGSTETGAIAMRRTAHTTEWRPLDGVRLTRVADDVQAWGTHFSSPRTLADQIEFDSPGTFRLLGRQNDLIKIAGRRASLAGLNLLLLDMPGLKDGVFYLPATDAPAERLVLIHSGSGLDRAKAVAWLRERMDPVFVPRTFIHVDPLPRTGTGKLPRSALDEIYRSWLSDKALR